MSGREDRDTELSRLLIPSLLPIAHLPEEELFVSFASSPFRTEAATATAALVPDVGKGFAMVGRWLQM